MPRYFQYPHRNLHLSYIRILFLIRDKPRLGVIAGIVLVFFRKLISTRRVLLYFLLVKFRWFGTGSPFFWRRPKDL